MKKQFNKNSTLKAKIQEKKKTSQASWKQNEIIYLLNIKLYYTNINWEKFHFLN
jgi:hypothetical protein